MARVIMAAGAALALAGLAGQALAQEVPRVGRDGYRQDVPGVMAPPRPPARPPESPFAAAYRRAGQPRMVLFFNRDIADTARAQVTEQRRDTASVTTDRNVQVAVRPEEKGAFSAVEVPTGPVAPPAAAPPAAAEDARPAAMESEAGARQTDTTDRGKRQVEQRTELTVQRQAVGARAATMDEASQWLFETGFTRRLATERVRMVDRAAAVRLASAARSTLDPQLLEAAAIREQADIAVLVRATSMAAAPGGQIYRVTAVDTRGGGIVADEIVTPPAGGEPATMASAAGEAAAASLMARLITAWTPPR